MAYSGTGTTYPTQNNLDIQINLSPVERDHWDDGIAAKLNWVYKYRRAHLCNEYYDPDLVSTSTTEGSTYYETPQTSGLWTPDDYDSSVSVVVRAYFRVTGAAGGANVGRVRVYLDDGTGTITADIDRVADPADTFSWDSTTVSVSKLIQGPSAGLRVGIVPYVLSGSATVVVRAMAARFATQGTIGV